MEGKEAGDDLRLRCVVLDRGGGRRRPGEAALEEIRKMQKSTELIISKAAISRVIGGNLSRVLGSQARGRPSVDIRCYCSSSYCSRELYDQDF
eukprot:scaffold371730_cov55-Attheya_sp.AAC.1